jgi:galactose mutarotase-like enzyme
MTADEPAYFGASVMRWEVGRSTYRVLPEIGARLMTWNVAQPGNGVRPVLHWPELSSIEAVPNCWGGNPLLFPFAGRCFDRSEVHWWRDPAGVRRPMPNHGLARQARFRVIERDPSGFAARLIPAEESRAAYPFEYDFVVRYDFGPLGMACRFEITNQGAEAIPWCAGHHFYFKVPWHADKLRRDYFVRIDSAQRFSLNEVGDLVTAPPFADAEQIGDCAVGGIVHLGLRTPAAFLGQHGSAEGLTVRFGHDQGPRSDAAFIAWTPAAEAPFYCVEPWMGPPNAPGNARGVEWVPPGAKFAFSVSVELHGAHA